MTHETISMIIAARDDIIQIATIWEWICTYNLLPAHSHNSQIALDLLACYIRCVVSINEWAIQTNCKYMIYWMHSVNQFLC